MKKIFTLLLCCASLSVSAQYLPNGDFSSWKTECGSTEAFGYSTGMRQRPGVEPTDWNGSSVNQKVIMEKTASLIFNEEETVKMVNTYVGVVSYGSVAPGFITLGTPWVFAHTNVSNCDGGTYGGTLFSYKPDAITGRFKRTDTTGEISHIIVYSWDGTFVSGVGSISNPTNDRENVDRAIIGRVTPTSSGNLIASCDYEFTTTTNSDWETITVPLTYTDYGKISSNSPTMMNIIISAGDYWTRTNMIENTTLYADDVQFIYNYSLSDLKFNGTTIEGFSKDTYSYTIDDAYTEGCITFTKDCVGGTAEGSWDATSKTYTIVVKGDDYESNNSHINTYTITFTYDIAIKDGETNLNELEDGSGKAVLLKRTFKAGWNTVCLPFNSNSTHWGGSSVKFYKLNSNTDGVLSFANDASQYEKNVPFLVYLPNEVNEIAFSSRTIQVDESAATTTAGDWTFCGSYAPSISMEGKWGVVNDGSKVRKGGAGSTLKSTRAYFEYNGTASVNEMRIIIDGEETTITEIDGNPVGNFDIYNLQGMIVRKNANTLDGLNKGIYIVNGKKYIVK